MKAKNPAELLRLAATEFGRRGGKSTSEAKKRAARMNGKKHKANPTKETT